MRAALLRARPWALSPEAWTPTPNGQSTSGTTVEAAFATALNAALPADAPVVRDASGQAVTGTITPLLDVDEDKVVGLRYTAVLKGGAGGGVAEDGRQLPAELHVGLQRGQRRRVPAAGGEVAGGRDCGET